MCKSVRGAAYFGSSLHLFMEHAFSFIFLFWFVFDTLISEININLWKCDPPEQKFSEINPIAHYFNLLFKLLYFTGLSVTGVYIFRGVERERPSLLKFATLAFVILQIVGVVLFSVFFSIQWNAEPNDHSSPNIEAARLVGEELPPADLLPASQSIPQRISDLNETKCNNMPLITVVDTNDNTLNDADDGEKIIDRIVNDVTPVASENVLAAPDTNDITTTTTTPIPPPPLIKVEEAATVTTAAPVVNTTTTTSTTEVPVLPPSSCTTPECMSSRSPPSVPQARKLPHNQLVRLVLQMCFAILNGLVSVAYIIVLALYMLKL